MATKEGELDQELMKAVARGQQQALEKLMDRHGGKVRGICKRILPKYPADQDDCYNDAWMTVWSTAKKFRGTCSVTSWIYRLTFNTCLMKIRKEKQWEKCTSEISKTVDCAYEIAKKEGGDQQDALNRIAMERPFIENQIDARKHIKAIFTRLESKLIPLRIACWASNRLYGIENAETSAMQGITTPAVKSHVHRVNKYISRWYAGTEADTRAA